MPIVTITYLIETAPPCDIEMMETMGWELIGICEHQGLDTAFFMANIDS